MRHKPLCPLMAALLAVGCAARGGPDAQAISERLRERTGAGLRTGVVTPAEIPTGVTVGDGLTADEAVAVALWNSPDFQVSLADLGFARADLVEAGLLRNPILSLLFPLGPKQLEATLRWPVEALWERPRRVAAARIDLDAAAERLVQTGLDLAASVKIAHADLNLAEERARLGEETTMLLQRINELTQARLDAGDVSELEGRAARVDAARARQDADRARRDVTMARDRLRGLLGFAIDGPAFVVDAADAAAATACDAVEPLLQEALASRPDVRAAELTVESAAARLGWERSRIVTLTTALDANGAGREGFEAGPGLDFDVPVFNRNQGGRARAAADLQRAAAAYTAVQQRVATELREAFGQYEQARESQLSWRDTIVAPLEQNVAVADRAFASGDTSYLFVLENVRRLGDARSREREIEADLRRARARVERALGRTCGSSDRS